MKFCLACQINLPDEVYALLVPSAYYKHYCCCCNALQGYNGSQLWDTSFAVQAMLDSGLVDVAGTALKKAHSYIEQSQVWQQYVSRFWCSSSDTLHCMTFRSSPQLLPGCECCAQMMSELGCPQVVQEADPPLSAFYRHISKGAWPFSSRDHGWPISDCTSEGFKAALGLAALGRPELVGDGINLQRLEDAVEVILSYQNRDGGMATYENTRSFHALEVCA